MKPCENFTDTGTFFLMELLTIQRRLKHDKEPHPQADLI